MFSECCSPEDLRQEAARQRRLAVFLKDTVVAASLRTAADELERQADLLESRPVQEPPQPSAA
jgi:hypothetical protein